MATNMLIDASHPEETRVVVVKGNNLQEFDFESSARTQLKGNIYLAKVTRVEPSLQAAFIDYGGNRHGFLAFNEIHPDYYQIPISDREALMAQQRAEAEAEAEAGDRGAKRGKGRRAATNEPSDNGSDNSDESGVETESVETVSGEEVDEISKRPSINQRYRIQEVIKRRQVMLVQVSKEERGNKGAALTTYVSLAGRYCVLMPNTTRGGGISRKIQSSEARKRLKSVVNALKVPDGMAVILRTAGQERSKAEIKRDYDYLLRLWDSIRSLTLDSTAPSQIHEEGNLIKRSIRDLYSTDIDEILVDGDDGYRTAKEFMRALMPSHAKKVQRYRDPVPLFQKFRVESQLEAMHSETVQLRSGGYIVINLTEALVSIDVNSGRATRERNIEETATKTNLEAADECARQMRLRDLAGLIVIDFIDMMDSRNARQVERRLKDAVRLDRARIQMGRISAFGLLEMSRQRLRPSLLEVSSDICPLCGGSGRVMSIESTALRALRATEELALSGAADVISVTVSSKVALYLLNNKRQHLNGIEERSAVRILIAADDAMVSPDMAIENAQPRSGGSGEATQRREEAASAPPRETRETRETETAGEEESGARRRRPRRRKARPETVETPEVEKAQAAEAEKPTEETLPEEGAEPRAAAAPAPGAEETDSEDEARPRRRRRGRRGGRRRGRSTSDEATAQQAAADGDQPSTDGETETVPSTERPSAEDTVEAVEAAGASPGDSVAAPVGADTAEGPEGPESPDKGEARPRTRSRRPRSRSARGSTRRETSRSAAQTANEGAENAGPTADTAADAAPVAATPEAAAETAPEAGNGVAKQPRTRRRKPKPPAAPAGGDDSTAISATVAGDALGADDESQRTPRRGWWQRLTRQ